MGMQNELFVEGLHPVFAAPSLDMTGAGQNGDWVNFKSWRKCAVVIMTGAWAAGTSAVTLGQATDNAGAGAKALAFSFYYIATGLTSDILVKTAVTSNTFNLSAANRLVVIEVLAADLDDAGAYSHFRVEMATPGANADLASALYVFYQGDRSSIPSTSPSAIS